MGAGCIGCQRSSSKIDQPKTKLQPKPIIKGRRSSTIVRTATSVEDIRKVYKFEQKIIGHGHFGTVRKAYLKTNPTKIFAVKTISKQKIQKDLHLLRRELEILKSLDHPNIVKFYESYQDERFFHLVMEYCSGGELLERICKTGHLDECTAANIMQKLFSAINYLHERGISHRDLKPENFLFENNNDDAEIKIIDFGLSKSFSECTMRTVVGTALYVAPEVLKGKYDCRCDNWSLGVITYVLLCGNPPFYGNNNKQIFAKILNSQFEFEGYEWKKVSKESKDFIRKLLEKDVRKRYTAAEAIKHNWLKMWANKEEQESENKLDPKIFNILKNFRSTAKFKTEALRVMVNMLNESDIKNLKEAFKIIDSDNSGMISFEELQQAMLRCGFKEPQEEIKAVMEQMNLNINEEINYSEFIAATLDKKLFLNEERLWRTFKYFDIENQNCITVDNLKEALARSGRKMANSELELWISEIDDDGNGKITFDEFVHMMQKDLSLADQMELSQDDQSTIIASQSQSNLHSQKRKGIKRSKKKMKTLQPVMIPNLLDNSEMNEKEEIEFEKQFNKEGKDQKQISVLKKQNSKVPKRESSYKIKEQY